MTGFDFSNNDTATHTTWSDMVSTAANRQSFITGAISFMSAYDFTCIDLDWEYPVDQARGGRPTDMVNLVQLLADMRARPDFANKFGISVTLAPDIWYLQHYDAKGMLASVVFLGFMAYVSRFLPCWYGDLTLTFIPGSSWDVGQNYPQCWPYRSGSDKY